MGNQTPVALMKIVNLTARPCIKLHKHTFLDIGDFGHIFGGMLSLMKIMIPSCLCDLTYKV